MPALMALLLPALLLAAVSSAWAQKPVGEVVSVTGVVLDGASVPVMGATVMVANHPELGGTVTGPKGEFAFNVPKGMVLQVSCIGFATQTFTIKHADVLYVTLEDDSEFLDEAVVVGYGVQKKESIVGAISTVSADAMANTGTNNIFNALNGKVAGMSQIVTSGAPGEDQASVMLRGLSSWNGSEPLYLVDGVERSMAEVNPDDVQSVSVLKDASATAVFGSKGANGVILVTTKTGRLGRPKMNLKVEFGAKSLLRVPDHISSATTVEMANLAMKNDGSYASLYSDDVIRQYRDGSNPYRYPDVDWDKELYKTFAPTYNVSFNISGGSKRVKYYGSVNYYHESSILKDVSDSGSKSNYSSDRIQYRLNLDADLTRTTLLSFKFQGTSTINNSPSVNTGTVFSTAFQATGAVFPAYFPSDIYEQYPDPNYPDASGIRLASEAGANFKNPMNYLLNASWNQTTTHKLITDLELKQNFDFVTKGLSARVLASLTSTFSRASQTAS